MNVCESGVETGFFFLLYRFHLCYLLSSAIYDASLLALG